MFSRSSFSEAAAWLPSTPRPSPTPPAGPRRAVGLKKPDPSATSPSDICSQRQERLGRQPRVAPETAEGPASAPAVRREEPSGVHGPEGAARRPPSGHRSSGQRRLATRTLGGSLRACERRILKSGLKGQTKPRVKSESPVRKSWYPWRRYRKLALLGGLGAWVNLRHG